MLPLDSSINNHLPSLSPSHSHLTDLGGLAILGVCGLDGGRQQHRGAAQGRGLDQGPLPGGGGVGQEERLPGGSQPHATGLPDPNHPLQTGGEQEEERQR